MWVRISPPAPRQWLIVILTIWSVWLVLAGISLGVCCISLMASVLNPLFCARCPPGYRLCGNVYSRLLIIFQNIGSLPHGLVVNEPN